MRRPLQILGRIVGFAVLAVVVVVLSPVLLIYVVARIFKQFWLVIRLARTWPTGKFVLVAYTRSAVWADYMEHRLIPQLGSAAVVIDRSRESWRRDHPIEAAAIKFWGGGSNYNPIVIVIRSPWRVRAFGLYDAFQKLKHGDAKELDEAVSKVLSYRNQVLHAGA